MLGYHDRYPARKTMNLEDAVNLVLAEAFAEAGLGSLAEEGGDPGFERVEALKAALSCLHEQLAHEDSLDRQLVSAFFVLSKRTPAAVNLRNPEASGYRPGFVQQVADIELCVQDIVENWNNWPDWDSNPLRTYTFEQGPDAG